jgi:hypothetical protein
MTDTPTLKEIAATAQAISHDPVTDPVDVRRQVRRIATLVAQLADTVADLKRREEATCPTNT